MRDASIKFYYQYFPNILNFWYNDLVLNACPWHVRTLQSIDFPLFSVCFLLFLFIVCFFIGEFAAPNFITLHSFITFLSVILNLITINNSQNFPPLLLLVHPFEGFSLRVPFFQSHYIRYQCFYFVKSSISVAVCPFSTFHVALMLIFYGIRRGFVQLIYCFH